MDKVYSRNIDHRQIVVSKSTQIVFQENKSADSITDGPPVFSEEQSPGGAFRYGISVSKTGRLGFKYFKKRDASAVLTKDGKTLRAPFGEIVVENAQVEQDDHTQSITNKPRYGKEILLFRSIAIGRLNYRFPTTSLVGGESLLRIFKLQCQGGECEGLDCNHGRCKEVNKDPRKLLGGSEMFLQELDFAHPINVVCRKCLESIGIMGKYQL